MYSRNLLSYIVGRINSLSQFYLADICRSPRIYFDLLGGRLIPSLRRCIYLARDVNSTFMTTRAYILEPEIQGYIRKLSHSDATFAKRVTNLELTSDDIETMVSVLSCHKIKLFMKGRTKFISFDED